MVIRGGRPLKGAVIHTLLDHRIAMAFSIAALIADGNTKILDSKCVDVSYPEFYDTFEHLLERHANLSERLSYVIKILRISFRNPNFFSLSLMIAAAFPDRQPRCLPRERRYMTIPPGAIRRIMK